MAHFNTSTASIIAGRGLTKTRRDGTRSHKSQLFVAASTSFLDGKFYETAGEETSRIFTLAGKVAVKDPQWMTSFVGWLRNTANMRSASILVAVGAVAEMRRKNLPGGRRIIDAAIARADEPAEMVAAWRGLVQPTIPTVVRKGINDAINRVWNEYSVAKYDTVSGAYSFRDVLNLCHPNVANKPLAKYIMDSGYGNTTSFEGLPLLAARHQMLSLPADRFREKVLDGSYRKAGLTWENVTGVLGAPDAELWAALLPSMGYMARLRSLRRLEEAGVDDKVLDDLAGWLADPANVAASRQLPLRFLSAYRQVASKRFEWPLEKALNASLNNLPSYQGKTLILVDVSGSMEYRMSERSSVSRSDVAAVFGAALVQRSDNADLVFFANDSMKVNVAKNSVLETATKASDANGQVGYGTETCKALKEHFDNHDRVIIITDDRSCDGDPGNAIPSAVPLFVFDVSGYGAAATRFEQGNNRYLVGGLTDQAFTMIDLVEKGKAQTWPWEN